MTARWTLRVRLTVLYGGLFFLAGAMLLGVTYVLVANRLDRTLGFPERATAFGMRVPPSTGSRPTVRLPDGREVSLEEAVALVRAEQQAYRQEALDSLLTQGGLALLGVGLVAGVFGWLLAGRALQPVHRITETARRIGGTDPAGHGLHERIALSGPQDEVKELADTFDAMLERLDRSFDGQRQLVANAAHELRTPLAVNRALIEVAITRPSASPDAQELGQALLAVNSRHERLIDGLLMLADSGNLLAERSTVDLNDVAATVVRAAEPAATEAGITVESELENARTTGDPVLLERLVQNLVENAVRHNHSGGSVWVSTTSRAGGVEVRVANTGPVVHDFQLGTIFLPFRRLSGERTAERGFGLGLSIVAAIVQAHGGQISTSPRAGGGLDVTVTLPRSRA